MSPKPTNARLRGVHVPQPNIVWATGAEGTVLLSVDAGKTWLKRMIPGTSDLDFRDVHALDEKTAWVLSIGEGERSRVYKTCDSGLSWTLQFKNTNPKGFLDAIAFWDEKHGLALGDPVDGRFTIMVTDDGGSHWKRIDAAGMPLALVNEGAFAASGTCLFVQGELNAWFGTGGAGVGRVFRSVDRGRTWTAHRTPIKAANDSSGIFSVAFRDVSHGVVVGGDYKSPSADKDVIAWTEDGGRNWRFASHRVIDQHSSGFRSAVVFLNERVVIAVGPTGIESSQDGARSWKPLASTGFHAISVAGSYVWGVGEQGRIGRIMTRSSEASK